MFATRPSSFTFCLVISDSAEWRIWSGVPPYMPQSPSPNGLASAPVCGAFGFVVTTGAVVGIAFPVPPVLRESTPLASRPTSSPPAARTTMIATRLVRTGGLPFPRRGLILMAFERELLLAGRRLEHDDRDQAGRAGLILRVLRPARRLPLEQRLTLVAGRDPRPHLEGLRSDLDPRERVRAQVVVPVGVPRRAALRPEHDEAVAVGEVEQRRRVRSARARPRRREQEHRRARVLAADRPAVRPELL